MTDHVPVALRRLVRGRSGGCCEYCRLPDDLAAVPHESDHVIASKHGGVTSAENLAWACFVCNRFKGSDIASIDPESGFVVRLFHPRRDEWRKHFRYQNGRINGATPEGRATASLLRFNLRENVAFRKTLHEEGRWRID